MRVEKKLNRAGALSIPVFLRRQLGIEKEDRFEIIAEENGDITLSRTLGSCCICTSKEGLRRYNKVYICKSCIESIKGE